MHLIEKVDPSTHVPGEADVPVLHGPPTAEEERQKREQFEEEARQKADDAFKNRQLKQTRASNWLTATNILLTLIVAGATWKQAQIASKTLDEIKNGGGAKDTHTLAEQAKAQSGQTAELVGAMRLQAEETAHLAVIPNGRRMKQSALLTTRQTTNVNSMRLEFIVTASLLIFPKT